MAIGTPYENVTLKALAAMYAGFPDNTDFWAHWNAENGTNMIQQRESISREGFRATPMSTPGTEFLYSNWGYVILGHVAEVSLNMTWEDALLEYLVLPLGLVPTSAAGTASYFPFGAPAEPGANWGHIYMNDTTPHYPCDPSAPSFIPEIPDFECDNCPNMGPAGR
jgi:CubicO group peptidase (beta-lactamase class C family)